MTYFIVEYRLPLTVSEAKNAEDAALSAKKKLEAETGILLSNWYARVFEYSESGDSVGPVNSYFFGPSGKKARKIDQNIGETDEPVI